MKFSKLSCALSLSDEIHEALHKECRVDYSKPILRNASVPILYEQAIAYEKGTAITASGALVTDSGAKKGRSPNDKRIVEEPSSTNDIWVSLMISSLVGSCQY